MVINRFPNLGKRRRNTATFGPPPILQLVSAVYSTIDAMVTLSFNRPIIADDTNPSAFWINDGIYAQQKLQGATFSAFESNSIQVWFDQVESYTSSTCTLDVQALNGIKDAATGSSWNGVTGFELEVG